MVKKTVGALALCSAAALGLAACGGGRKFGPGVPPPRRSVPSTVATPSSTVSPRPTSVPTTTASSSTAPPVTARPTTTTTFNTVTLQGTPPAKRGSAPWAASMFIEAYYGTSYTWPSVGYWVVLAKPYMTPTMYKRFHYLVVHADNPSDAAYMAQLRSDGTTYLVDVSQASTEADAPNTTDKRYVLVTYQVDVLGLNEPQGGALYGSQQVLQCTVVRARPGAPWQVSNFQEPNAN